MKRQIMSLGTFIAKRRKQMMMTQEMLAEKMHVSKSAIAKWETDGGVPDRDNLKALADILEVTVDRLHRIMNKECEAEHATERGLVDDMILVFEEHGYMVIRPTEREV